jgi:hypothetical protein
MIFSLGRSTQLAKIDIRQAFRLLIVNPADFDLLGIKFDGKYYIEKCLPMGCSISCALFELPKRNLFNLSPGNFTFINTASISKPRNIIFVF